MFDGTRLAQIRESRGIGRSALAQQIGVSVSALSLLEANKRSPTAKTLEALAVALGVSAEYLLGRVDEAGDEIIMTVLRVHGGK